MTTCPAQSSVSGNGGRERGSRETRMSSYTRGVRTNSSL